MSTRGTGVRIAVGSLAVLVLGILVAGAILGLILGTGPELVTDEHECNQPSNESYGEPAGLKYSVHFETIRDHSMFGSDEAEALIGVDPGYGFSVRLTAPPEEISAATCEWLPDRVVITESNGVRHSVPASEFTGGR